MKEIRTSSYCEKLSQSHWDSQGNEQVDHAWIQKHYRTKTDEELHFIIEDAQRAMEAMPEGSGAGKYADQQHYAAMELQRRRRSGKFKVEDNAFNQSNYADMIGREFDEPPGYAAVRPVASN